MLTDLSHALYTLVAHVVCPQLEHNCHLVRPDLDVESHGLKASVICLAKYIAIWRGMTIARVLLLCLRLMKLL
jgi:hypothetical protein